MCFSSRTEGVSCSLLTILDSTKLTYKTNENTDRDTVVTSEYKIEARNHLPKSHEKDA